MDSKTKKKTREEVLAWAAGLVDADEPSVLASATPRPTDTCQTAAKVAVGQIAPRRVASLANRFARLLELEASSAAAEKRTARRG